MLSAVGKAALSEFLDQLCGKLASNFISFLSFVPEAKVRKELEEWKRKLLNIQTFLDDAEGKQMKDPLVKEWLADLQDLFYDADDILDEFSTEALRCKLQQGNAVHTSKVQKLAHGLFASLKPSSFLFNRDMMSKLEGITMRLNDLEKERNDLGLTKIDDGAIRPTRRLRPTSLVDETQVYGREKEKATILKLLSSGDENGVSVIPIVGMGGIGKTTLAQLVYNDPCIQSSIDGKAWVCVSEEFDAVTITKTILNSITVESYTHVTDLNFLQVKLKEKLYGKRFFLVLDDVWNENFEDLTILLAPFGAKTKILLTTRSHNVSSLVGTFETYKLQELSKEGCLSIFAHHALSDFSRHPELKDFGERIVKKCKGMPLAAKAVGGLLRGIIDYEVWKDVSESEIWDLPEDKCGVIPALRLSYHHLPSQLKRCFAYCAIFPKDYEFGEEETVLLWKAEGFLQPQSTRTQLRSKGREYFQDLVSRSFFQVSSREKALFVMHDLVNDLAQVVAGRTCSKLEGDKRVQFSQSTRHSSYPLSKFDGMKKFEVFNQAKNLRTFLPFNLSENGWCFLSNVVLNDLLPKLNYLRVLSLSRYSITELPNFFENLKQLRYLDFSYTKIKCLPGSISNLYHLETFLLKECSKLEKLPEMENLINLEYLDISGANSIQKMPFGIGELTNLQKLPLFVLGKGNGDHIRKVKNLANIRGDICLSRLENIVDAQDAREAKLSDKWGVEGLELKWKTNFDDCTRSKKLEEQVLNFLCPQKKLSRLTIENYGGATFSTWVADSSFNNLSSLKLINCKYCISLPLMGKLQQLKDLLIKGMDEVNKIGVEFFGKDQRSAFGLLKTLQFEDMPNWTIWDLVWEADDHRVHIFPRLVELSIKNCPRLLGRLPSRLQSLQKLVIHNCMQLVISISSLPLLQELNIKGCQELMYSDAIDFAKLKILSLLDIFKFAIPPKSLVAGLTKLEDLKIGGFELGDMLGDGFSLGGRPGVLQAPTFLTEMHIERCPRLVSFADGNFPPVLKKLVIKNCKNLEYLFDDERPTLCLLEHLKIIFCPSLTCLSRFSSTLSSPTTKARNNVLNRLQHLEIVGCSNLTVLFQNLMLPIMLKKLRLWDCLELKSIAQQLHKTACLESIQILECPKIQSLPQGLQKLSHLEDILIDECSNLVSFQESDMLPGTNLRGLSIYRCRNFGALPKCINNFTSLRQLIVWDCSADISFPEKGGFPTNLTSLLISGAPKLYASLVQWGFHRLTSLEYLSIGGEGCLDVVSFPEEDKDMMLPPSLTSVRIKNFKNLQYMCSKGFQALSSLRYLCIEVCDKLTALPEKQTLLSLGQLYISRCPLLKKELEKGKGREWSKCAHVPHVQVDDKSIIQP